MSLVEVYQQIQEVLAQDLCSSISQRTLKRLTLLVTGTLVSQQSSPSQIAQAIDELQVETASVESIERRIRRSENDPAISAQRCYAPYIRALLQRSRVSDLILILDPTTQADHFVMVSLNAWYRGRSLPLAWTLWPGNVPLEGAGFWERMEQLMGAAQKLLPAGVRVTILADRAFGPPAFTDLAEACGWHWVVRIQDQTLCQDRCGRQRSVSSLVNQPGQRRKQAGKTFKKAGWRPASIVVYWGPRHRRPLCLASDLPPRWELVQLYRRRYPIEGTFRDYKSYGWHWEQGQVRSLAHIERLLVSMALAACLTLVLGAQFAAHLLTQPSTGKRHTRPWFGKRSLFRLGLLRWKVRFRTEQRLPLENALPDWLAPNWSTQLRNHHARAFIFA